MSILLRASGDRTPTVLLPALRAAVRELDADVPVYNQRTLREIVDGSTSSRRFVALLLAAFALVALSLAGVGVYGVMANAVAQRRREIGVRMALGAPQRQVFGMIVRYAGVLAGLGIAIGWPAAAGFSLLLAEQLFGVSGVDPITYAAVAAFLLVVALLASWLPARRAVSFDPVETMRAE